MKPANPAGSVEEAIQASRIHQIDGCGLITSEEARLRREMSATPGGRRILTLTPADRIEDRPVSCLDRSMELLATHQWLRGGTNFPAGPSDGGGN
ncbi:MAG: hypothetical protein ACYDC1_04065 [Limisphaerales bacterium]